jgi:hypothetical protein
MSSTAMGDFEFRCLQDILAPRGRIIACRKWAGTTTCRTVWRQTASALRRRHSIECLATPSIITKHGLTSSSTSHNDESELVAGCITDHAFWIHPAPRPHLSCSSIRATGTCCTCTNLEWVDGRWKRSWNIRCTWIACSPGIRLVNAHLMAHDKPT